MSRQEVSKQELLIPFSPNTSDRSGLQNRIWLWKTKTEKNSPFFFYSTRLLPPILPQNSTILFFIFVFTVFFSLPFYSLTLLLFVFILFLFLLIILFLCLNLCLTLTNLFSASSRFKFLQSKILSRTYLFVTKDDWYTDRLWIFESCGSLLVTILKNHFHHFHPFLLLPLLLKDIVRPSN